MPVAVKHIYATFIYTGICALYKGVPVLALTGTADKETQKIICDDLLMLQPLNIFESPNRKNLRFSVKKAQKNNIHVHLDWLVNMVKEMGVAVPKTIIFCNTLKDITVVLHLMPRRI